jgi:hypothetical protein
MRHDAGDFPLPDAPAKRQPELLAEQHYLGDGEGLRVSDRQKRAAGVHSLETARRAPVKPQLRRSTGADDFNIAPEDALRVPRAEGFHRCLLRREAAGEMWRGITAPCGICNLAFGKHAVQKPIAEPRDGGFNPIDLGGIHSDADNIH